MRDYSNRKLKIAHVVPVATPIPAPLGGSVEQVSYLLTEELVRRGHEVTLFATGNTHTSARLAALFPHGYYEDMDMWPWEHYEMINLAAACERAAEFDVIHYQAAYYPMSTVFSRLVKTPLSQTIHLQPPPEQVALWRYYAEANFVAISEHQRQALEGLNCAATIYHGLDLDNFPFSAIPEDYLAFLGRFTPGKGILQAIEVAKRTGLRLKMAAAETEYFHEEVKQHIDGRQIEYLGELGHADKVRLLGGARALLYPVQAAEPFGLVLTEAMACGTPVAALNQGAVPEIVSNGLSGYAAATLDELIEHLPEVMALPRAPVRRYVEAHFSVEAMTDGYEKLFYRLASAAEAKQGDPRERSADAAGGFCAS
ncbi:MAG: glycosyltransferase family 4 protein [Acidobacteria bacterium]|nr:glycosyltransferase family 4 protein [Acidobacteriota bacterium]MBI3426212.1 glycosyltransferase family 4 protein [Acidobacteriota bacterium]